MILMFFVCGLNSIVVIVVLIWCVCVVFVKKLKIIRYSVNKCCVLWKVDNLFVIVFFVIICF